MTLRQTVDAVVEEDHIEVDVTTVGVDEVVTTDSQTVAVARYLPDGEVGVSDLGACSDGSGTTVNGIHAVSSHVVGQTAGTTDTRDDCDVLRGYANLGHSLME